MKFMILFIFLSIRILTLNIYAQEICNCEPTTDINNQERSDVKHITNFNDFPMVQNTITPEYIYAWQDTYDNLTKTIAKKNSNPQSARKHDTPEDSIYVLKGYMYFVKQEANDCDLHIEIGPKDENATRIVVEVPTENCNLQNKIYDYITKHGYKLKEHFPGIPCVVTGIGFYDASHKPNTNHGDAHTKKYSWELHPVKNIIFLDE